MPHDRRRFLQQMALAGTAIALGRASASPVLGKHALLADTAGEAAKFGSLLGHGFKAGNGSSSAVLKLTEVLPAGNLDGYPDASRAREQSFTLIFNGGPGQPLADGIYRISGQDVAPFEAFMSSIGDTGSAYQIVFNRI